MTTRQKRKKRDAKETTGGALRIALSAVFDSKIDMGRSKNRRMPIAKSTLDQGENRTDPLFVN